MSVPSTSFPLNPSDFTTEIDNPFLTWRPGTTFVAKDSDGSRVVTEVTRETRVVDGVTTVVVRDIAYDGKNVVEDTFDWYAQDRAGNVWYFGEDTTSFEEDGTTSKAGSFESGVAGARAGIVMLANPEVGDNYFQEQAPGVAEDQATVLSVDASESVAYGNFVGGLLQTHDFTELDLTALEDKYYAEGIGFVLATTPDGGREELISIQEQGTEGDDVLLGYAGAETLIGLAGDDTYTVNDAGDKIVDSDGVETVESSISYKLGKGLEHLVLTGDADIDATGNREDNEIVGNAGINSLKGSGGDDVFHAGDGDTVLDFKPGRDQLSIGELLDLDPGDDVGSFVQLASAGKKSTIVAIDANGDGSGFTDAAFTVNGKLGTDLVAALESGAFVF